MTGSEKYTAEFIAGDQVALHSLYADTSTMLYRVVFRMVGNREETEDILHDVYIRAYEHRNSYNPKLSDLRTWLYRIAVNYTLNQLKRRKWLGGNLEHLLGRPEKRDVLDDYVDIEEQQTVQHLLQQVPEDFRICLVLRDIEDRSYEDIARVLKLELGTVKSRLSRGRKILKDMYRKEVAL